MANLVVYYPRTAGADFDAAYYAATHIPLVESSWRPHGLRSADILWPVDGEQPFVCMVTLGFPDQAAIDAALAAPETGEVMADVARFTTIQPGIYRTE